MGGVMLRQSPSTMLPIDSRKSRITVLNIHNNLKRIKSKVIMMSRDLGIGKSQLATSAKTCLKTRGRFLLIWSSCSTEKPLAVLDHAFNQYFKCCTCCLLSYYTWNEQTHSLAVLVEGHPTSYAIISQDWLISPEGLGILEIHNPLSRPVLDLLQISSWSACSQAANCFLRQEGLML
jgi:hypothetical protein